MPAWLQGTKVVVDADGRVVVCAGCPCLGGVPIACCDFFGVCIEPSTPIPNHLFATVRIRRGPGPGGEILASFSIPISYTTGVDYSGLLRNGWLGCRSLDPETQWLAVATVFLQCEGGEFLISFNGYRESGHPVCDGFVSTIAGTTGTVGLVASPFAISNTGVDFGGGFAPPREEDIWVEVDITT